jgi:nucleoside-diphosphate-sugar epimerase
MHNRKPRILITGASGFIGKNLVEYLSSDKNKYSLFYPCHKKLELLDANKVTRFIRKNDINVIVHCANIGGSRKTRYDVDKTDVVSTNLRLFFNLVRTLDSNRKIIFLGSGAEYAKCYHKPRMKEDYFDTYIPQDDYGFSKYVCSKYIENSEKIVNLRLFGVFGKYEDYQFKFISNAIVKNLFGLPIVINQNVYFDYLYIDDCVKIIEYFINHNVEHKFYNLVTGKTINLITIANKINEISRKPSKIIVKNPGLNTEYSGDNKQLLEELQEFRFTPFEDTLKELYCWYESHIDKINKQIIIKDKYFKYCKTKL